MRKGTGRRGALSAVIGLAALACLGAPAGASAASHDFLAATGSLTMQPTLSLEADGAPEVLDRVTLRGRISFPGQGRKVRIRVTREGRKLVTKKVAADPVTGRYRAGLRLRGCCDYVVQAFGASGASDPVRFTVEAPTELGGGRQMRLFNELLSEAGFLMGDPSEDFTEHTALAVMAMRKTHDMERTEEYDPALFRMLLQGGARFQPEHSEEGRHVEVDVSRQVMALVEDGVAKHVFHVSTGAGGTPYGQWSFYLKAPGYNAKGMYYSVFYDGNYATHGYESVPTYPASHGCTRNPPAYSVFIYNWIELGDTMYVYA